jgi:hypothetical protein
MIKKGIGSYCTMKEHEEDIAKARAREDEELKRCKEVLDSIVETIKEWKNIK